MSNTEVARSIPRRLTAEELRAALNQADSPASSSSDIDPLAVGTKASEGVAAYITAAQHIEATVASIKRMSDEIEEHGKALAADLRRRGEAMDKMVENYSKLAAGTKQRMEDERKHLEEIAKG